jgi:hypothetical protein
VLVLCCSVGILLHILTKVDVTETAASDLAANTVLVPHAEVLQTVSDVVLAVECTAAQCPRVAVACRVEREARTMVVMVVVDLKR